MKGFFWGVFSGTALLTSRFISSPVTKAKRSAILTLILMRDFKIGNITGEYPKLVYTTQVNSAFRAR